MFTFGGWTLDELHTVATLAGNGVKRMMDVRGDLDRGVNWQTYRYMTRCIEDAERLLEKANNAIEDKN